MKFGGKIRSGYQCQESNAFAAAGVCACVRGVPVSVRGDNLIRIPRDAIPGGAAPTDVAAAVDHSRSLARQRPAVAPLEMQPAVNKPIPFFYEIRFLSKVQI